MFDGERQQDVRVRGAAHVAVWLQCAQSLIATTDYGVDPDDFRHADALQHVARQPVYPTAFLGTTNSLHLETGCCGDHTSSRIQDLPPISTGAKLFHKFALKPTDISTEVLVIFCRNLTRRGRGARGWGLVASRA